MSSSHTPLYRDAIPVFNGDDDVYGWVLDIDEFFVESGISSTSKLLLAVAALQGPPLQWWLEWSHNHPTESWESFIAPFLWHFKPEWQHLLPTPDGPCVVDADLVTDLLDETVHVTPQPPPIQEPVSFVTAEQSRFPSSIVVSDWEFASHDSVSEKHDSSFQSSNPDSDSASNWESVTNSDGDSSYKMNTLSLTAPEHLNHVFDPGGNQMLKEE